ncbi:Hypothetical_protein [Hexamita inflata]|uniref:Hypothetical_protein n=1 Tax=Hexamita inflata TaxID=28002 RepID=A0AA86U4F2_9EUKA|nr:Hypothetical protein HINF_LOCUS26806 [Hexamita inflata]
MMVHSVALFVSRRIRLPEMRLGQIGCGRQNPPIQSAKLLSRIGMATDMPSTSLRIGKRQPLYCFLRNADGTMQVASRRLAVDWLARYDITRRYEQIVKIERDVQEQFEPELDPSQDEHINSTILGHQEYRQHQDEPRSYQYSKTSCCEQFKL